MDKEEMSQKLETLKALHKQVRDSSMTEPDSMFIATQRGDEQPSIRVVLVKELTNEHIVFYTNLKSRKSREILANPNICLFFDWKVIGKRIRIQGRAQPVSTNKADRYFSSRDRGSQIGAWASKQSSPLVGHELHKRIFFFTIRFFGRSVKRPVFWSGYKVSPDSIEIINLDRP